MLRTSPVSEMEHWGRMAHRNLASGLTKPSHFIYFALNTSLPHNDLRGCRYFSLADQTKIPNIGFYSGYFLLFVDIHAKIKVLYLHPKKAPSLFFGKDMVK